MDQSLGFDFYKRSEWQLPDEPISGPVASGDQTENAVVHYTGRDGGIVTDAFTWLRNTQHAYLTSPARGYSLGYGWLVLYGAAFQIRGPHPADMVGFRMASNPGDKVGGGLNDRSTSIIFGHGVNAPIPQADIDVAVALWRWFGFRGRPTPHSTTDPTGCPGDPARAQIASGLLDVTGSPLPPPEDDMPKMAPQSRIDSRTAAYHTTLQPHENRELWVDLPDDASVAALNFVVIPTAGQAGWMQVSSRIATGSNPGSTVNWETAGIGQDEKLVRVLDIPGVPGKKSIWVRSSVAAEFIVDVVGPYWG